MADIGCVVVDPNHLIGSVDLQMRIEVRNAVNCGLELTYEVAIIEARGNRSPAIANRRADDAYRVFQ